MHQKINGYPLSEDVWSTYFVPKVNGNEVRKHILSYTWQRPRDIIRMLRFVQDEVEEKRLFHRKCLIGRCRSTQRVHGMKLQKN